MTDDLTCSISADHPLTSAAAAPKSARRRIAPVLLPQKRHFSAGLPDSCRHKMTTRRHQPGIPPAISAEPPPQTKRGLPPVNPFSKSFALKASLGLVQVLKNTCRPHAPTDAHRHHTVLAVPALHLMDNLNGQLRSRATQRMPHCNRPAVHVHLLRVHL